MHKRSLSVGSIAALVFAAMSATAACNNDDTPPPVTPDPTPTTTPPAGPSGCDAGFAGVPCLMQAIADVQQTCDADQLGNMVADLQTRRGYWAMWHDQTAMFVAEAAGDISGTFNSWTPSLPLVRLCDSGLFVAMTPLETGTHQYKIVRDGAYELDAGNWAFAYDAFAGNADGRNSVLNTYDSGRGHLEAAPDQMCSEALGNCRALTTYVPPGYASPLAARPAKYPVLYVHDGQNVFDDNTCCFGGGGWEINLAADSEISAGKATPFIIVAADHGELGRNDEYGWAESVGGRQETFMAFQVNAIQPYAEAHWDIDGAHRYVLGSSLGGLISYRLAFAYPTVYKGAGAMSGAFWPGLDTGTGFLQVLAAASAPQIAMYLDHGGTISDGGDGMEDSVDVANALIAKGFTRQTSPACSQAARTLCYHHEPGAEHTESAWRARAWRPIRFFFAP